ncbi:MAG TPA: SDR family NAD(P)-dependent oxidoreductase [Puia sp.]|nr:SDR family NAD(P)-dependent oxidoreductase [Puia sp.]
MTLNNKVAIVTGAGQGIGYAIVQTLLAQGARVLLNDSDGGLAAQAVERLAAEVGDAGSGSSPHCIALAGDAGDPVFIRSMVDTAVRTFGRLDIVVANAGLTLFGDFFGYTPASFEQVMRLNLGGTFFLAQAAAIQMRAQGDGGSIVFTSSVTGHQAHKHLTAYGMSKAAIEMLARGLVVELSPYRITVNAVAPGATLTERTAADANYERTWSALTPMGRPATPADIAQAVLFLAGPGARHITGQTLVVDGGWTVVSPGPETA